MKIIPAIDILDGKVVSLTQGNFETGKVYSNDPVKVAKNFVRQGAKLLHVINLDKMKSDKSDEIVKRIINESGAEIQLGGGIRTAEEAVKWLDNGASKIIFGTALTELPNQVMSVINRYRNRVLLALDFKDNLFYTHGWTETNGTCDFRAFTNFFNSPIGGIIYTNINKDGTLSGADISTALEIKKYCSNIIISGGIGSEYDIYKCSFYDTVSYKPSEFYGLIIGKAIYENKVQLNFKSPVYCSECKYYTVGCNKAVKRRVFKDNYITPPHYKTMNYDIRERISNGDKNCPFYKPSFTKRIKDKIKSGNF
ncbi:MAG: 1-(5-phosphoribosyl)-5-[(5-phosphoribosylamino)methylideneamino] imidazole-4-carboxamide isomerase [Candidatus Paceibacterota bacterium]|jgi:phosphoribosylformimino-5-aminoimidazole carboxamide ribotide isomerase